MEREEIVSYIAKVKAEKFHYFHLNGKDVVEIPPEIGELDFVQNISIGNTKITSIPATIGMVQNVRSLNLNNNQIRKLPPEIGNLRKLETLLLSRNNLSELPPEIGTLESLKRFESGNNQISIIPKELCSLTDLETLSLGDNNLTYLPAEIGNLVNLKRLVLARNNIATLPAEIKNMVSLEYLDLRENPISDNIPLEILERTDEPRAIIDYYWTIKFLGIENIHINECKVLIVGQGSVGKTSLVMRITKNTFDPSQLKTEGISINHWYVGPAHTSEEQQPKIKLNIWDFGGQEIMHATHQFFLTKRSLYLLVLDSRLTQEENRVEYWLKIIQSFGGESPILIVGNKIDQHPLDIDRTGLQKKYPNIVGILETSAATGTGIEELKAAITEQVNNLPHVRDLLPETWFTVKTKLEELGKKENFISHDDYINIWCAENDICDEVSQRTLIGFLHDLGVVLYFQDDRRLEQLGILNPQWVTNGVYKILNSHALFQNKGVLPVSMLDEILNLPEYPRGKRLFIVDMMKKFELCYDIDGNNFLIPDLLPKDEPYTGNWDSVLAFQYHYSVLPSSIMSRFIVRMHGFIDSIAWRSGVVLRNSGNRALVKADTEDRRIYIWVEGDEHRRRDFLAKIRGEFDAIHKTIARIEAKEMIPVPGHSEADPVDYDLLMQMEHNNVEVYPLLAAGKMIIVNVRDMLNGIEGESARKERSVHITHLHFEGDVTKSNIITGNENTIEND